MDVHGITVKTLDFNSIMKLAGNSSKNPDLSSWWNLLEYSKKSDCAMEAQHVLVPACPNL
jgi:hypothetical protein